MSVQPYNPLKTVMETVTTSYTVPQSSLVIILKELAKSKQNN